MPTLIDVAAAAGVSRSTVSNVFAHPELVRGEVRERVEAAARAIGYDGPDPRGRLLREGRFNAIGFVVPDASGVAEVLSNPYGQELLVGIAEACDEAGVSLTIVPGAEDRRGAAIKNALVDGFILSHPDDVDSARLRRLPFVLMEAEAGPEANAVRVDGLAGARLAAEHLAALGHRQFVIVSVLRRGTEAVFHPPGRNRALSGGFPLDAEKLRGYAEGFAASGLSIDRMPIIETAIHARDVGQILFERAPEATAALVMSDRQAITILAEARRRGISVPRELSVIGFDGVAAGAQSEPPLTTIAQPIAEKGRIAARMILGDAPPRQIVLPVKLVGRASTAAPRKIAR